MEYPAHPGELVKEDVLPHFNMTISAAAEHLGVNRANLSAVLNGKASLSTPLALKLEAAFGVSADLLTQMQRLYDLAEQRRAGVAARGIARVPEPA